MRIWIYRECEAWSVERGINTYIRINNERLSIKPGVFKKEWYLLWNDIEKIKITVIKIEFLLKGKQISELNYYLLEYEHIQAIKGAIREFASEKQISITE